MRMNRDILKVTKLAMIFNILKVKVELLISGEAGCHNRGNFVLIFFHVSDHLDLFGGVLFLGKISN